MNFFFIIVHCLCIQITTTCLRVNQLSNLKIYFKKKRLMHFKKRHTESHMTIPWTFNAYCPMFILAVHHTWVKDVHFE